MHPKSSVCNLFALDSSFVLKSESNILSKEHGFCIGFCQVSCPSYVGVSFFPIQKCFIFLNIKECFFFFSFHLPLSCCLMCVSGMNYLGFVSCSFMQAKLVLCFSSLLHYQYKTCLKQFSTSIVQLFSAVSAVSHITVGIFFSGTKLLIFLLTYYSKALA